jgi:hypothetical protein
MNSLFYKIKSRRYGTVKNIQNIAIAKRYVYPNKPHTKYNKDVPLEHMRYWWDKRFYAFYLFCKNKIESKGTTYITKTGNWDYGIWLHCASVNCIRNKFNKANSTISYANNEKKENGLPVVDINTIGNHLSEYVVQNYARKISYKGPFQSISEQISYLQLREVRRDIEEYIKDRFIESVAEYKRYMSQYKSLPTEKARPNYD